MIELAQSEDVHLGVFPDGIFLFIGIFWFHAQTVISDRSQALTALGFIRNIDLYEQRRSFRVFS